MHPAIRKALTSRYLLIALGAVLLYALAGFVAAPWLLRWYAPDYAARHLHCRAVVDRIAVNPFLLTAEIDGFSLEQANGAPLIAFERLFVDLEASSLFHRAVVLREVALTRPAVQVVAEADGSLNLARLAASPPAEKEADAGPFPFILRAATIRDGRLAVVDQRLSAPAGLTLHKLDLDLQGLATVKEHNGTCRIAATTDAGESIRWDGEIALAPFQSSGRLSFEGVRAATLWQFVRDSVNLEEPEGRIDLTTACHFSAESSPVRWALEGAHLSAAGLALRLPQADTAMIRIKKLDLTVPRFDPATRELQVARLLLAGGAIDARLDEGGGLNLQQLIRRAPPQKSGPRQSAPPAAEPGPAWKYLVKSFEIEAFAARFTDLTTAATTPVVDLRDLTARLSGIDGRSPMPFTAGWKVAAGGSATVRGTVNPAGPAVDAEIEAADVALTSLQPYLEPHVSLKLESALASAKGTLRYGVPGEAAKTVFAGSFTLGNLRLVEPAANKPYLGVDALRLPRFRLTLQPNGLTAPEIRISRPVGEVIIGEDRTLNFARVLKRRPAGPPPSSPPAAGGRSGSDRDAFAFELSRILVEKGDMVFADLSLQPQFTTRIHDLKGSVTGLSSRPDAQARVRLDGQVDRYGTARIKGVIRPDDFRRSSDITMVFRNLEMKSLSPYSGKFAGRLIKSGKISADLKYSLQDYRMTGDNQIVIDKLILGERVASPAAANLPLDLALALLRDSSGRIDIGLPVSGDLNDPHFSFGALIGKMLANVITRTATAPFQILAKLFGGKAESFDRLAFAPGRAELPPPEREKLLQLAAALKSRPQLKLVVQGRYSPEADGRDLRTQRVRTTVVTRLGEEIEPGARVRPLDFGDSDVRDTLEKMYRQRFGGQALEQLQASLAAGELQPRAAAARERGEANRARGLAKMVDDLKLYALVPGGMSHDQAVRWAEELYGRLVDSEEVADEDFRQLAEDRAQSIVAGLEDEGGIDKARIAVKAAEPLTGRAAPAATLALDAL